LVPGFRGTVRSRVEWITVRRPARPRNVPEQRRRPPPHERIPDASRPAAGVDRARPPSRSTCPARWPWTPSRRPVPATRARP
jgi:hypothetical protein